MEKHTANLEKLNSFINQISNKKPVMIVTLGDSNTCNFTYTDGGKQWPELVQTALRVHYGNQCVHLFNAGICGDTSSNGLARIECDVLRFTPDLVIIAFGTNDANRISPSQFSTDMGLIIQRLLDRGSKVLLRTVLPIMENQPTPKHIWDADHNLKKIIDRTQALAVKFGLPFLDLYNMWRDLEKDGTLDIGELMADEVHANAKGHYLVAKQTLELFGVDLDNPKNL